MGPSNIQTYEGDGTVFLGALVLHPTPSLIISIARSVLLSKEHCDISVESMLDPCLHPVLLFVHLQHL